jgi:hypothetical protein
LRLVGDYIGPWASTKLVAWHEHPQVHTGRFEVPDIAVLRHTPDIDKSSSDLVTVQLRRLVPGRYTVGITHLLGQDPIGSGAIQLRTSEGATFTETTQNRPAYYAEDDLVESFQILEKTRPGESGSIFITIHATNTESGPTIDLDRLIVRRVPDGNTWGHSYSIAAKK